MNTVGAGVLASSMESPEQSTRCTDWVASGISGRRCPWWGRRLLCPCLWARGPSTGPCTAALTLCLLGRKAEDENTEEHPSNRVLLLQRCFTSKQR